MFEMNEILSKPVTLWLEPLLPNKQLVIIWDTREHVAGNVVLTKCYTDTAEARLTIFLQYILRLVSSE